MSNTRGRSGDPLPRTAAAMSQLAGAALETAQRQGGDVPGSVTLGLPAARLLTDGDAAEVASWLAALEPLAQLADDAGGDASPRLAAGMHKRNVYYPLVVHLHLATFQSVGDRMSERERDACLAGLERVMRPIERALVRSASPEQIAERLWQALCLAEWEKLAGLSGAGHVARDATDAVFADRPAATGPRSLHALPRDESLDFWTYRELASLHALDRLAQLFDRRDWAQAVTEAATFHQQHTQPDYTTYEPWAVHVFARSMETVLFADQQLHDATTNLELSAGAAAPVVALLLADAVRAM